MQFLSVKGWEIELRLKNTPPFSRREHGSGCEGFHLMTTCANLLSAKNAITSQTHQSFLNERFACEKNIPIGLKKKPTSLFLSSKPWKVFVLLVGFGKHHLSTPAASARLCANFTVFTVSVQTRCPIQPLWGLFQALGNQPSDAPPPPPHTQNVKFSSPQGVVVIETWHLPPFLLSELKIPARVDWTNRDMSKVLKKMDLLRFILFVIGISLLPLGLAGIPTIPNPVL